MRIESFRIAASPPIDVFSVDDLTDVVVLAGPNGVGKTRLISTLINYLRSPYAGNITATLRATRQEERDQWGGLDRLDLSDQHHAQMFAQTLQSNKRRRKLASSLVNFESDRAVRNLAPLPFSWEQVDDPGEEHIGWDLTFGFMRDRFQDTLHSMFRLIEAQKQSIANRAINLRRQGHSEMQLGFGDPMEPFKEIFSRLLAPKELVDPSARNQTLQYTYRGQGQVFNIDSLSSGEREVVNIAFDFLLRAPEDCVVFFDEPELHLHPELSYRLLQALQEIGHRNQFFFATHSPDIISSSLENSVIFVSPPHLSAEGEAGNQAVVVQESDETNQALRLLGQSVGIVSLGRKIVLVEGTSASLDKQVYGSILRSDFPDLSLVPSAGKGVITSFKAVHDAVLANSIWGVDFFMLCDGDSAPDSSPESDDAKLAGSLRVLGRYHLENYFLDEQVWALAMENLEGKDFWARDAAQVRAHLIEIAREYVSYSVALSVSARSRILFGNVDIMPKDCHGKTAQQLSELMQKKALSEVERSRLTLDGSTLDAEIDDRFSQILESLDAAGDDAWKKVIPGKPLLGKLAHQLGMNAARAKRLYISAAYSAQNKGEDPFSDIRSIFATFSASRM